jgi:hypothetical protein
VKQKPTCQVSARLSQIKEADHCIQLQLGRGTTELTFEECRTVLGDQVGGKPLQTQIGFK